MEDLKGYLDCLQSYNRELCVPAVSQLGKEIASHGDDQATTTQLCEDLNKLEDQWDTYKKLFEDLQNNRDVLKNLKEQEEHTELLDYGQSKQKEMFEKCFGLKFKLTEDKALDFQFQYLAPSHPDRSCTITLDVNSEGQWEVIGMAPDVEGVTALVEELNKTQNLTEFCKTVRQKFKRIALEW